MKKYYGILLAVVLVLSLSLSGCGKQESKGTPDSKNAAIEQETNTKNSEKAKKGASATEKTATKAAEGSAEVITTSVESTLAEENIYDEDDNYDLEKAQMLLTQDLLGEGYSEEEVEEMLEKNPDLVYDYAVDYQIVYEN